MAAIGLKKAGYADRLVLVETNSSASLNETTCWENLEYLQASVVAACCQQILTVVGNHEIAWVSACCRITDLFQCSIRENMESTDAVILEAMGSVEPSS